MAMRLFMAVLLACLALVGASCGGDDDDESAPAPEPTASAQSGDSGDQSDKDGGAGGDGESTGGGGGDGQGAGGGSSDAGGAPGTTIEVADSDYGPILFDSGNQAIYLFDKEEGERSECYGACAEAWPPVLTEGDPQAAGETDSKLLGTIERDDGTTQVTYGGHPLYYYAHEGPGEVLCHNVEEFGGLWLVVTPQGDAVS
jgi:predicted lipoprotein with Yx(FWY)xxD motif